MPLTVAKPQAQPSLSVQPLANPFSLQGYGPGEPLGVFGGSYSTPSYDTGGDYSSGSGGSSSGSFYSAPAPPDPYAKWGGLAGYQQAVKDYGAEKTSTDASITDRINSEGSGYNSSILDFLDTTKAGQKKIDTQSEQNELSKIQGGSSVLDMLSHGLKSGGVMLANKNATNSSAADELARAWGDIGRRNMSSVNNQYEQGKSAIQSSQDDLASQISTGQRHISENKTQVINSIVSDAQTAIAQLNQDAANASLPDRVDIEGKKQEVRNRAMSALQAYDASLTNGLAGIKAEDSNSAKTKASQLNTAGIVPDNLFNFTTNVPQQFQGTGPFADELPIFTQPKKQDTQEL